MSVMSKTLIAVLILAHAAGASLSTGASSSVVNHEGKNSARAQERVALPSGLKCERSSLTSYNGRVLAYSRRRGRTVLRVRTDFETTEVIVIRHPRTDDPSEFYLLNGEPFKPADWRRIEKRKGVLRAGMRANVWVCRDDPSIQPVVDWRPVEADGERR